MPMKAPRRSGEARRVNRAGLIAVASSFLGVAASIALHSILARCLDADSYGLYNYFVSSTILAAALSLVGLDTAATVLLGRHRECAGRILHVGVAVVSASLPAATLFVHYSTGIAAVLSLTAVAATATLQLLAAIGRGLGFIRQKLVQDVATRALLLGAAVSLVTIGLCSPGNMLAAFTVSQAAGALALLALLYSNLHIGSSCSLTPGRILREATALYAASVAAIVLARSDTYMIGLLSGLRDVALYSAAALLAKTAGMVFESFGYSYLPIAASVAGEDPGRLRELYRETALTAMAASLPPVLAAAAAAPRLLEAFFGPTYVTATPILEALAVGYIVHILAGYNGMTLIAVGEGGFVARVAVFSAAINTGLNAMLIPLLGGLGAAIATATTLTFQNILLSRRISMLMGSPYRDPEYVKAISLYTAAVAAAVATGLTGNLLYAAIAAVVYLASSRRRLAALLRLATGQAPRLP